MSKLLKKAKNFAAEKVGHIKKPEASLMDVDLKSVHHDCIEYIAKVSVDNPYGLPLPIREISYTLKSVGSVIASGTIPDPGLLKAHEQTTVDVLMKVPHSVLVVSFSWTKDIAADWDIHYQLDVGLIIDLPIFGNFTIPLSKSGEIKLPKPNISDLITIPLSKSGQEIKLPKPNLFNLI